MMKTHFLIFLCVLAGFTSLFAQKSYDINLVSTQPQLLQASAGENLIYEGNSLILGGNPTSQGGTPPYSYQWIPDSDLDNPEISNPAFLGTQEATYSLIITDQRGCSARDTISIIISATADFDYSNDFIAYPNPNTGSIRLKKPAAHENSKLYVKLFDSSGRLVIEAPWSTDTSDLNIDVSRLTKGSYMLTVTDGANWSSRKIIIQ